MRVSYVSFCHGFCSFGYGQNESELSSAGLYSHKPEGEGEVSGVTQNYSWCRSLQHSEEGVERQCASMARGEVHTHRDVSVPRSKSVLKRRPVELQEPC